MSSDVSTPNSPSTSRASSPVSSEGGHVYDERKPIDKNLPPMVDVNLRVWVDIWERLNDSGNLNARDTFALTGHFTDPETGERRRARLNFSGYRPTATDTFHQISDIDSVIAMILGKVPVKPAAVIKYHMIFNAKYTLKNDLHIPPVRVPLEGDQVKVVIPHKVPNTRLFTMEPQAIIRIFFPFLQQPSLDEDHMRQFYNLCWLPAATAVMPEELLRELPETYDEEKFRGQRRRQRDNGENHQQTGGATQDTGRDIHARHLNPVLNKCREIIAETEELRWARNFFLGYEMRGMKNREDSMHPPPEDSLFDQENRLDLDNPHPRTLAIQKLLRNFDIDGFEDESLFVDIATRVVVSDSLDSPAYCTFASTATHAHLLEHFVPLEWSLCEEYAQGRGNHFRVDEVAHLKDVSGWQFFNPRYAETGICTVQVYSTDKSAVYNLELAHNVQRTSARAMILDWPQELQQHLNPLINLFESHEGSNGVALRMESRVEYKSFPDCHLLIPDDILRQCLYRIESKDFWGYKRANLISLTRVGSEWNAARQSFNIDKLPEVGTLILAIQFKMNALVNRPDSGGNWDQVRDNCCVHIMKAGVLVPDRPLGGMFLPAIHFRQNEQPRVSSQRTCSRDTICYLLGTSQDRMDESDVYYMITKPGRKRPREDSSMPNDEPIAQAPRVTNKQQSVRIMRFNDPDVVFGDVIPVPERERYPSEDRDPEARELARSPNQKLNDYISSYAVQIMRKAPFRQERPDVKVPWCRLSERELKNVPFRFFSSRDRLQEAFESYVVIPADADKWDNMVASLFPHAEGYDKEQDGQGLKAISARDKFISMQQSLLLDQQRDLVHFARDFVSQRWLWLPYGYPKKHLWATGKPVKSAQQVGPVRNGPWIIFNPALLDE